MMRAIDIGRWRQPLHRRLGALLAVLAIAIHTLAMAAHQPASALPALPDFHAALCLASGEPPSDPLPGHDPDGAAGHQGLFCPICQSLQAGGFPPQSSVLACPTWAAPVEVTPAAAPAPPPRLVLTDLNPRGPPRFA
jgi:Protein of unknown function (DUF2946)